MKWLPAFVVLFAFTLSAADISGNWKATAKGPNGSIERTFTFKQDGNTLTGETASASSGKTAITDGKVDGDTVTFSTAVRIGGQDVTLNCKGKIAGDEIKLTSERAGGGGAAPIEWTAKKQ